MKHCSDCGGELTRKTDTHFNCPDCGRDHYINPKGTVAVVLLKDANTAYMAVRAREPQKGKQDCLGGFLDVGENFEQALYRELQEEAGISKGDISELKYLSSSYDPYPWQGGVTHTASVYFVATLKKGIELKPNDDVAEIIECRISELDQNEFAWDGMKTAFTALSQLT
jgi:NADH pyrophosphatase NudC (nudix superfamily)